MAAVDVGHERGGRGAYDGVEVNAHDIRQGRHGESSLLGLPGAPSIAYKQVGGERGRGGGAGST